MQNHGIPCIDRTVSDLALLLRMCSPAGRNCTLVDVTALTLGLLWAVSKVPCMHYVHSGWAHDDRVMGAAGVETFSA